MDDGCRMEGYMDEWMQYGVEIWMNGCRMNGYMDIWMQYGVEIWMNGCRMGGYMDEWMQYGVEIWMNGCNMECRYGCMQEVDIKMNEFNGAGNGNESMQ